MKKKSKGVRRMMNRKRRQKIYKVPNEALIIIPSATNREVDFAAREFSRMYPKKRIIVTNVDAKIHDLTKTEKIMLKSDNVTDGNNNIREVNTDEWKRTDWISKKWLDAIK